MINHNYNGSIQSYECYLLEGQSDVTVQEQLIWKVTIHESNPILKIKLEHDKEIFLLTENEMSTFNFRVQKTIRPI